MMSAASSSKQLQADKFLQSQGFGGRKFCKDLIESGLLFVGGQEVLDPKEKLAVQEGLEYVVGEESWVYRTNVYVIINKPPGFLSNTLSMPVTSSSLPAGYECSSKPSAHKSVFDLFPQQFQRSANCRKTGPGEGRVDVTAAPIGCYAGYDGDAPIIGRWSIHTRHDVSVGQLCNARGVQLNAVTGRE
eukprot:767189-Hanusia_phi.AAC.6